MFTIKARSQNDCLYVYATDSYRWTTDDVLEFAAPNGDEIILRIAPHSWKDVIVLNDAGVRVEYIGCAAPEPEGAA